MEVSPVRKCYNPLKQECGREMRILIHTSFVYCSSTQNLPFNESNICCTSEMSRDMTRVREGDLALRRGLFMERSKIDAPSLCIGLCLSVCPSDHRHRYIKEHLLHGK